MNSGAQPRARGQPIIAFLAIAVMWALLRIAMHVPSLVQEAGAEPSAPRMAAVRRDHAQGRAFGNPATSFGNAPARSVQPESLRVLRLLPPGPSLSASRPSDRKRLAISYRAHDIPAPRTHLADARGTIGVGDAIQSKQKGRRWRADGWILLREGGTALGAGGAAAPVYGASQAGLVLRYDIGPGSPAQPVAYARVVYALGGTREGDIAAGMSARPLPGIPLNAHVEVRASRRGDRIDVRPAAFLTAGIDEAALPLGLHARGYAQAGYVGGRDASAFADGSLIAERRLLAAGETGLAAGIGLWGGAQRGAQRLDVGPSASLRFPLGTGSGRATVDYRLRLAGNADPAASAVLTLSAGF